MQGPGGLRDLGPDGGAAWAAVVSAELARVGEGLERPGLLPEPDERTSELTGPDWTGLPVRVVSCLGRREALRVLDRTRRLQEEYLEWRVKRTDDGAIARIEMTTELPEYWRVLAARNPSRLVEVAADLVGREVDPAELYGGAPPDTLEERAAAFVAATVEGANPLQDGREGILFMTHPNNNLHALLKIGVAAFCRCVVCDEVTGRERCGSADEVIELLSGAAMAGRASDPVIVERLGRLAFEQRVIALDDPIGIYIQGIEHTRLRTRDGEPVSPEWFRVSRGLGPHETADGNARHQRLVFEVPDPDLRIGDLVDTATGQRIEFGGQIAELVQLRVFIRASEAGRAGEGPSLNYHPHGRRADPCAGIAEVVAELDQ